MYEGEIVKGELQAGGTAASPKVKLRGGSQMQVGLNGEMDCALDCCPLSVLLWCAAVEMADYLIYFF